MAEVIISSVPIAFSYPKKHLRGMPIEAREDGFAWGYMDTKAAWVASGRDPALWHGNTILLKLPQKDHTKIQSLISPQIVDDTGAPYLTDKGVQDTYRACQWVIDFDNLPAAVVQELKDTGEYTIDTAAKLTALRSRISRIRDGANYAGL